MNYKSYDDDVNAYIAECIERIQQGQLIEFPKTQEQLIALSRARPQVARRYLPQPAEMAHIGLPHSFGRLQPFEEQWQDRFLFTLKDKLFLAAVRVATRRAC
jgi:hypothetical protein